MEIFKTLDVCDLKIDIYDGPIGCSTSGGADSSILAYILLKYAPGPINFYVTDQRPLFENRVLGTRQVVEKLLSLIPRDDVRLVETQIFEEQSEDNIFVKQVQDIIAGDITMCYTGITSNPPGNPDFGYADDNMAHRTGNQPTLNQTFYTPFINHDKSKVAELYNHFDVLEEIFPLTFSCTESQNSEHCGDCWWCAERKWAFGRLV